MDRVVSAVGVVAISLLCALVFAQILFRYSPVQFVSSEELIRATLVAIASLGFYPFANPDQGPSAKTSTIEVLRMVMSVLLLGFALFAGIELAELSGTQRASTIDAPISAAYVVPGSVLLCAIFVHLTRIVRTLFNMWDGRR